MTDTENALRQKRWHKWMVRGVTLAIVAFTIAAVIWYLSRAKRWDTTAVSEIWSEAHG